MLDAARAPASPPSSTLPGPFPVGTYATRLKARLQAFAHVQLVGEAWGVRAGRARIYFELRDARGALPCSIWCSDFETLGVPLRDGMRVVVGGGCDLYPGSATSSPSFSFAVTELREAGEGDLLAQLERLRRALAAEGLLEPQKRLPRPALPRTIGVVTGETGKARDDVVAGLRRRGWGGRLVWAFAPVQDRHAAPRVAAALRSLAAVPEVEVVIVARGGGSLADLFAFCDETLCRTVALLRVPVISSVGHHADRTLLDDVAAVACSTPTHAAEAAVPLDVNAERAAWRRRAARLADHRRAPERHARELLARGKTLRRHGRSAVLGRARLLAHLARAPGEHVRRGQRHLHGLLDGLAAASGRSTADGRAGASRHALVLSRSAGRAADADAVKRRTELRRLSLALGAHDPARTLARGYVMVTDGDEEPLVSAEAAREAHELRLRFTDGVVTARVHE
jgi:exodeoxyribonuclease VII large subunit